MVAQNAVLATLTVGLFWGGILVARAFGKKTGYSLAPLGFRRPRGGFLAGVGVGAAVGVGGILAGMIVNPLSVLVLERLGYSAESTVQQPLMRGLQAWVGENPGVAIPAMVLVVVVIGPAVEELVFRGAIFNGLRRLGGLASGKMAGRISFILSALVSSAVFALLHLEPVLLPALLLLAFALCYLFEKTGSLLPPIVAHATFNSFATTIIILSGLGVFDLPI